MNVTEEAFREYIELFHRTLDATAREFLDPEDSGALLHLSLLPAQIVGYLSTHFGVAIEYTTSTKTDVRTVRSSRRIEELFVQAPTGVKCLTPLVEVRNVATSLTRVKVSEDFPFRLNGPNSVLALSDVEFKIGSWRRSVKYAEVYGNRTAAFWNSEQAVTRAKDEVLAALVQTRRARKRKVSLGEYIKKFKQRTVLLLGDYDEEGLLRLGRIRVVLVAHGYDAILIKDIPDQPVQSLPQKVRMIGCLARFVIVDDSSKSGHLMEVELCRQNEWITVLLRYNGKGGSWMTAGASVLSTVIHEQSYTDADLKESVSNAIGWSEKKIEELNRKFDSIYPWRAPT